jgi:hypothetical protein
MLGHVKIYSTQEFKTFFQRSGFSYIAGKSIIWSVKINIGEKATVNLN